MVDFAKYKPALRQYLARYGIDGSRGNVRCFSESHNDPNASLQINDDYFFCHGCGYQGDIFDACERFEGITDAMEQYKFIERSFGGGSVSSFEYTPREEFAPDGDALAEIRAYLKTIYKNYLEEIETFCRNRGYGLHPFGDYFAWWPGLEQVETKIDGEILKKAGIPGWTERDGKRFSSFGPAGVIVRLATGFMLCYQRYDQESGKLKTIKRKSYGSHSFPFPELVTGAHKSIILVEGEMGALAMRVAGVQNAHAIGGISALSEKDVEILKTYDEIIILGNNDDETHEYRGQIAAGVMPKNETWPKTKKTLYEIIISGGYDGKIKSCVPISEKDEDDLIKAGKLDELRSVLANAKPIDRALLPVNRNEKQRIVDLIESDAFAGSFGHPKMETLSEVKGGITIETTNGLFFVARKDLNVRRIFTTFEDVNKSELRAINGQLTKNENGGNKRTFANVCIIADRDRAVRYSCALSVTTYDIEYNQLYNHDIDYFISSLKSYFSEWYGIELSEVLAKDTITRVSRRNCFNPITDFLHGLPRAEKNPLHEILSHVTFANDGENHGIIEELFDYFFRKMFINILKTDYQAERIDYQNDCIIILSGEQGTGKSTLIRHFGLTRFYFDIGSSPAAEISSKDSLLSIAGVPVIEIGELSTMNKTSIEAVKSFLSKSADKYRKPYARDLVTVPRISSFIGTSNKQDYLADETGNRRFFPVEVKQIDMETLFNKKPELFRSLWAWYGASVAPLLTGAPDEVRVKIRNLSMSPTLQAYLGIERTTRLRAGDFDEMIEQYIYDVEQAQNFERMGRDIYDAEKYLNYTECVRYVFGETGKVRQGFMKAFVSKVTQSGYAKVVRRRKNDPSGKVLNMYIKPPTDEIPF